MSICLTRLLIYIALASLIAGCTAAPTPADDFNRWSNMASNQDKLQAEIHALNENIHSARPTPSLCRTVTGRAGRQNVRIETRAPEVATNKPMARFQAECVASGI